MSIVRPPKALFTSLFIDAAGQVKLFQIKLPRETERVIGIEASLRWIDGDDIETPPGAVPAPPVPLTIARNTLVGELKLQSCGSANVFYTSELKVNRNLDFGDFSSPFWKPQAYSHVESTFEARASASGSSPVLQGIYRDRISTDPRRPSIYVVNLYTWIITKAEGGKGTTP